MITPDALVMAGICTTATAEDCLWVESGLSWLRQYTTLDVDQIPLEQLPAGAKLFLQRYADVLERGGIASESIEGLSQSFTDTDIQTLLLTLAQNLLPEYYSAVSFVPRQQMWRYRHPRGGECQ